MLELEEWDRDPAALRRTFACFPSGVVAVCAAVDGAPVGMAVSSFTSVSVDPPMVSVCVQTISTTWPTLCLRPRLGISVLAEGHDEACRNLSRKAGDRFAGIEWEQTADGAVFVHGATAWLDCSVDGVVPAGDHTIVLLEIRGLRASPDVAPLVFHGSRFHALTGLAPAS
ncbi:flavin reductase family protein [Pseudonocardia sp. RS11V-5]|uniref:flavin reductase family protein n=1 Tax=Pseudonocardia terrae TaxID=2905831 RepID=UPI001E545DB8|nr:flavin reductase family protein [Pseudonocardia terrae]MCE3552892.1 flavin reductase family protein [Pseudonocardia terrae]